MSFLWLRTGQAFSRVCMTSPCCHSHASAPVDLILQVCMLEHGQIIGDMTVLANIKTRTASVMAATDVVTYRVRRALFLRRVPPDILEVCVSLSIH